MFWPRLITFCLISASLAFSGCDTANSNCCIHVGQTCIDTQTFQSQLERFVDESMITSQQMLDEMKETLVKHLIEEHLILQYAKRNYIAVSEEEVDIGMQGFVDEIRPDDLQMMLTEECRELEDIRSFIRKRTLIKKALNKAIYNGIIILPEEISSYYEQHRTEFHMPESVELYHVFFHNEQQAKQALIMLRNGKALADVIKRYSVADDAEESGYMGCFVKGDMPKEVEDVVFSIPEKRYSGIISTMSGYHIFYVAKKNNKKQLELSDVTVQIRDELTEIKFEEEYAKWIKNLEEDFPVEVKWNEIEAVEIN